MNSLYTERLETFLERNSEKSEWNVIKGLFNSFPKISIIDDDFSFYDLFIERYNVREIGAETENLFYNFITKNIKECIIKYKPKVLLYLAKFNNVLERKINLEDTSNSEYFLNPISSMNAKVDSGQNYKSTKEVAFSWLSNNTKMMNEMLEIRDIYYEALDHFEKCFMGVM